MIRITSSVLIFLVMFSSQVVAEELLPVEYFARLPDLRSVTLSPDGEKIAGIITLRGESVLIVKEIATGRTYPLIGTDNEDAKINWIRWGNNERLLLSYRAPYARYGVRTTERRLMSIRYDGEDQEDMFRSRTNDQWFPQFQDRLVDVLPDDEEHFLLALDAGIAGSNAVYKIDIDSGGRSLVRRSLSNARDWITDQQHEPRIAVTFEDTDYEVIALDPEGKNRRTLWEFESFSDRAVWPLGFGLDPNTLYVKAYYQGRYAVFKVNLEDPELALNLLLSDPYRDVEGSLIHSPKTGEAVGVYYSGGEGLYHFWDDNYRMLSASIDAVLPQTSNRLLGFSDDERRAIIFSSNDITPGTYYLWDRDRKTLDAIGDAFPELTPDLLSEKNRVEIEARDGLQMEAYLTLPASVDLDYELNALPAIVFPHGGPISADDGDFDYWTQFFASRGYAVMQINFRGSSGYGFEFMSAGIQNYGLKMQDDLEDATDWLVRNGIASLDRICIVGGSYGGYAALMGVVKTPDLYACAVSFAGLSDLVKVVSYARNFTNKDVVREQFGADRSLLRAVSPRELAENISAPVLLAHGDKDRVVPVEHSRLMRTALKKADKEFEYLEFDEGDHYLSNSAHRLSFFKAMDAFLSKHLKSAE